MNSRNRLRRAALVLALLVLAAIVTGVAASATKTAVPKQLTGAWLHRGGMGVGKSMIVGPGGKVRFGRGGVAYHAKLSRVTAHRLRISGVVSCSGTGTYRWQVAKRQLKVTKIHDACEMRVGLLASYPNWR